MALGKAIGDLYFDKEKCREFGDNGYRKAATVYSRETIYEELMGIYIANGQQPAVDDFKISGIPVCCVHDHTVCYTNIV